MKERTLSPLFTWRSAICDSGLPAPTRHVALVISLHMNERGGSCFPEVATIALESGLHRETVTRHIKRLVDDGWLRRRPRKGTSTEYFACQPSTGTSLEQVPTDNRCPLDAGTCDAQADLPADDGQGYQPSAGTRTSLGRQEDATQTAPPSGGLIVDTLTGWLLAACRMNPTRMTRSERGKARTAARLLAELDPPPTEVELFAAAAAWRRRYKSEPTPLGIANNFASLAPPVRESADGRSLCDECSGDRQVPDPAPDARGMIACPTCHGTGRAA